MSAPTALYTVEEARTFDKGQVAKNGYTDAEIEMVEARTRARFARLCGVQFIPTSTDEHLDGDGMSKILLPYVRVTAVTACVIYDADGNAYETFAAEDIADLAVYPEGAVVRKTRGSFLKGARNVHMTFTHGYEAVPEAIKWAALRVCMWEIVPQDGDQRMTALTADGRTWSMAVAGRAGFYYGLPEVDEVLKEYDERIPSIA
jgi:hypothetical protein